MWKFIGVLELCLIGLSLQAQDIKLDAVYVCYSYYDTGLGARVDLKLSDDLRLYSGVTYGDWHIYRAAGFHSHTKFSLGVMPRVFKHDFESVMHKYFYFVNAGINYHLIGSYAPGPDMINPRFLQPWSIDIGVTSQVWRKYRGGVGFAVSLRMDLLRHEPEVNFGLYF